MDKIQWRTGVPESDLWVPMTAGNWNQAKNSSKMPKTESCGT